MTISTRKLIDFHQEYFVRQDKDYIIVNEKNPNTLFKKRSGETPLVRWRNDFYLPLIQR